MTRRSAMPEGRRGDLCRILMLSPTCAARVRAGTPMVCRLRQDFNSQARRFPDRSAGVTPFIRCTRRLQALRALR